MRTEKLRIVFMGTPDFAVPSLKALATSEHDVVLVVCQPDKSSGRGQKSGLTPVKKTAESLNIPVLQPERIKDNRDFSEALTELMPDLIVVAAYGKILPENILGIPSLGCINIHASLLPKYRGAAPVHRAIEAGEKLTGVSLMCMTEGLDEGDVLATRAIEIGNKNSGELTELLAVLGAEMLLDSLPGIAAGTLHRIKQDNSSSTYAPPVKKEEGHVVFTADAEVVLRKIRAMNPKPGAYAFLGEQRIRLIEAVAGKDAGNKQAGDIPEQGSIIDLSEDGIKVSAGIGTEVLITKIQMPGKKAVAVADYLRGNKIDKGRRFL